MDDQRIIDLYWQRSEAAIAQSDAKYGSYCRIVAQNILDCWPESEECVNDTWLHAWNAMPPKKPEKLKYFLAKLTRNLAFDRFRARHAQKRGGGELPLVLDELSQCCAREGDPQQAVEAAELQAMVDRFLRALLRRERSVFLRRYFFAESIADIAHPYHLGETHVRVLLHRTRQRLKAQLEQEGYV